MQVRVVSESCLQRDVRRREQRAMSPTPCAGASLPPRAASEVLRRKTALGRGRGADSAIANGADAALLACAAAVPGAPASATHPLKLLAYYWHPIRHARGSSTACSRLLASRISPLYTGKYLFCNARQRIF